MSSAIAEGAESPGMALLPADQRAKVLHVKEILAVPEDLALDLLRTCSWNAEAAVERYMEMVSGGGGGGGRGGYGGGGGGGAVAGGGGIAGGYYNSNNSNVGEYAHPVRSNSGLRQRNNNSNNNNNGSNSNNQNNNVNNTNALGEAGLLERLARGIFRPFEWLFQSRQLVADPDADALLFRSTFLNQYNSLHPPLPVGGQQQQLAVNLPVFEGSYKNACGYTHQASRVSVGGRDEYSGGHLLIYLHAPMHQDTDAFCTNVLFTPQFERMLRDNQVIFWAGSLWCAEAYELSESVAVSSYPCLVLLRTHHNYKAAIVEKIQGVTDRDQIIERMTSCLVQSNYILHQNRQVQENRTQSANLRAAQDLEYQQEQDRVRRERSRKEQEEREARLKADRDADEARQREYEQQQAEELERAIAMSHQLSFESEIERRQERLGNEPGADVPTTSIATIRFQTPSGVKLTRKFFKTDTVDRMYDYMLVHFFQQNKGKEGQRVVKNILISINGIPKKDLPESEYMSSTIESVGLTRGAVVVEDLDS